VSGQTNPVLAMQASLTDRDLRLLDWLYDHRVLTTPQIAHALFPSLTFCQRRLLRLTELRVVARFRPQRADGGTFPYHYLLDQLGHEIVAAQRGDELPRPNLARAGRQNLTSRANLAHIVGTNEVFIQLAGYARTHPAAELLRWWPASRASRSWRVRPDGAGVWRDGDRTVPFHLEYDRGTEPLGTLLDKISRYEQASRETGLSWPALLWLPTAARELHLHQHLGRWAGVRRIVVATTATDRVVTPGRSPPEAVWWPRGTGDRIRLADVPYDGPDPLLDGAEQ
jgi:hypothetical protein